MVWKYCATALRTTACGLCSNATMYGNRWAEHVAVSWQTGRSRSSRMAWATTLAFRLSCHAGRTSRSAGGVRILPSFMAGRPAVGPAASAAAPGTLTPAVDAEEAAAAARMRRHRSVSSLSGPASSHASRSTIQLGPAPAPPALAVARRFSGLLLPSSSTSSRWFQDTCCRCVLSPCLAALTLSSSAVSAAAVASTSRRDKSISGTSRDSALDSSAESGGAAAAAATPPPTNGVCWSCEGRATGVPSGGST
mmetsp:Transcript_29346/g.64972  ORF Transcript_29346/g.64972 Transcript_29346/m.64972 type:complete len:251 (-) Transcript_29346:944-1696(-)